jgi:hypothetical protein
VERSSHFRSGAWHRACPAGTRRLETVVNTYRVGTLVLAALTIALGVALIAATVARGGGIGILIGLAFMAAGAGRLYLARGGRR